ncbi:hypothetical protein TSOC_010970 [Tetrabaena socialis]|uniref:Uncharacterized protein n=1 Tax=Tetrabaena socialis TaxID=47790 RepID=A0A2J7ZRW9_9CHLO|nr:hypothetical protein TSOC_010970 [Tetrabaena socialis]|eukprot:PNH03005.1 hypothetical protein TSOC_010970 [Tetrabaena socialis]
MTTRELLSFGQGPLPSGVLSVIPENDTPTGGHSLPAQRVQLVGRGVNAPPELLDLRGPDGSWGARPIMPMAYGDVFIQGETVDASRVYPGDSSGNSGAYPGGSSSGQFLGGGFQTGGSSSGQFLGGGLQTGGSSSGQFLEGDVMAGSSSSSQFPGGDIQTTVGSSGGSGRFSGGVPTDARGAGLLEPPAHLAASVDSPPDIPPSMHEGRRLVDLSMPSPPPGSRYTMITWWQLSDKLSSGPAVVLAPGQQLSLSNLVLFLADLSLPLGASPNLPSLALSLLFDVPAGARLELTDVVIVLSPSDLESAMLSICSLSATDAFPYSPGVAVEGGIVRLIDHRSTIDGTAGAGGEVHWTNVTLTCLGFGILQPPCAACSVATVKELTGAMGTLESTWGPVYLSITADLALPTDGSWEQLVNLGYSSTPKGWVGLQAVGMQGPFRVYGSSSSTGENLVSGPDEPPLQLRVLRCTLVIPDPELAFLVRAAAASASGQGAPNLTALFPSDGPLVSSYDYSRGVLVLAEARWYGVYGTDVTVSYKLPDDAPHGAKLLSYPPLLLPYQELADLNINIELDFSPPPSPSGPAVPAAPDHTPVDGSNDAWFPGTAAGLQPDSKRPGWLVPVVAAVSAVGGVAALAAAVWGGFALAARRRWRRCSSDNINPKDDGIGGGGGVHCRPEDDNSAQPQAQAATDAEGIDILIAPKAGAGGGMHGAKSLAHARGSDRINSATGGSSSVMPGSSNDSRGLMELAVQAAIAAAMAAGTCSRVRQLPLLSDRCGGGGAGPEERTGVGLSQEAAAIECSSTHASIAAVGGLGAELV